MKLRKDILRKIDENKGQYATATYNYRKCEFTGIIERFDYDRYSYSYFNADGTER